VKQSIQLKLDHLSHRFEEISALLSEPEVQNDQNKFRSLSQEYAQINPIVETFRDYEKTLEGIRSATELTEDDELRDLAEEEIQLYTTQKEELAQKLQIMLLPKDPNDSRNIFLEIRAGTGGAEAAIFSGDLSRMYHRFAEANGWTVETLSESLGEHGGFKEIILRVVGQDVYSQLKFEAGTHRVQRVPETETQGRIHTSACTVAVMPEAEEVDEIDINPADIRTDTYRASGSGGQHVNKTDSAVRLTHIPSGIVVECQDERSQHKNRARAMSLLKTRLLSQEQEKQNAEIAQTRKKQVGSGDRSERIRTYNFPQGRLTDHRINLTLYKLDEILQGNLKTVIEPLISEHQAELLTQLSEDG